MNWQEQDNVRFVNKLYSAFVAGDIPLILTALAADVEWTYFGDTLPWGGVRNGPAQVSACFDALLSSIEYSVFEPREFIAQGDQVVVIGDSVGTIRTTGKSVQQSWTTIWTIHDRVVNQLRFFDDTAKWQAALNP